MCVWYIEIQREQICDGLKDREVRKALLEFKKRYIYKKKGKERVGLKNHLGVNKAGRELKKTTEKERKSERV